MNNLSNFLKVYFSPFHKGSNIQFFLSCAVILFLAFNLLVVKKSNLIAMNCVYYNISFRNVSYEEQIRLQKEAYDRVDKKVYNKRLKIPIFISIFCLLASIVNLIKTCRFKLKHRKSAITISSLLFFLSLYQAYYFMFAFNLLAYCMNVFY